MHWFAYLENAPEYSETDNDTVARFYDNIISCSSDVPETHKQYIQYHIHRHSRTCGIGNTHKYRLSAWYWGELRPDSPTYARFPNLLYTAELCI